MKNIRLFISGHNFCFSWITKLVSLLSPKQRLVFYTNTEYSIATYRHPLLGAVNWFQKNRALSETALSFTER
jgi:hypothetical protein